MREDPIPLSAFHKKAVVSAFSVFLMLLFIAVLPDLTAKAKRQRVDRTVAFVADWDDLIGYSIAERKPIADLLHSLNTGPFHLMALPYPSTSRDLMLIRENGFPILWKVSTHPELAQLISQGSFKEGDGVLLNEDYTMPIPNSLVQSVARQGFFPVIEFQPASVGLREALSDIPTAFVKAHYLSIADMENPKPALRTPRLVRAVRERWVRLLYVRFSRAWDFSENIRYQNAVAAALESRGFYPKSFHGFQRWNLLDPFFSPAAIHRKPISVRWRLVIALFIGISAPVVVVFLLDLLKNQSTGLVFAVICFFSTFSGLVIHGLGSAPGVVLGLIPLHGVKLQLTLPLLIAAGLIFWDRRQPTFSRNAITTQELGAFINPPAILPGKAAPLIAAFAFLIGIYLWRSGNVFVLDAERTVRDALEAFFSVRPRIKEFLIGHPFLIVGLYLKRRFDEDSVIAFYADFFTVIGLIGQISILNTFMHFAAPITLSLLRVGHGIWVGAVLAVFLCCAAVDFAKSHIRYQRNEGA